MTFKPEYRPDISKQMHEKTARGKFINDHDGISAFNWGSA